MRRLLASRAVVAPIASLLALLASGTLLMVTGVSPIVGLRAFLGGAFGGGVSIGTTLTAATPYVLCALGFTLAYRSRLFNIGLEGQLLWGAVASVWVGTHVDVAGVGVVLSLLAAAAAGGLWALIPVILRLWRGASEIVSGLFLNYVAFYLVAWVVGGPLRQPASAVATTSPVNQSAQLPVLVSGTKITIAPLIAIAAAVMVWAVLRHSVLGYKIRTIGANPRVAERVGMNARRTLIVTFAVSGVLGGLAGGLEVLGNQYVVIAGFSRGWGYTGIAAALLGGASAFSSVVAGFFFGVLDAGARTLQLDLGVPFALAQVAQAVALVAVIVGTTTAPKLLKRTTTGGDSDLPRLSFWKRVWRRGEQEGVGP